MLQNQVEHRHPHVKEQGGENILLFGGGIIPDEDIASLEKIGVSKLYTPGATTQEIIDWLNEAAGQGKDNQKIM